MSKVTVMNSIAGTTAKTDESLYDLHRHFCFRFVARLLDPRPQYSKTVMGGEFLTGCD